MFRTRARRAGSAAAFVAAVLAIAGCGSASTSSSSSAGTTSAANAKAPDVSPAGDIPDNQAFVAYRPPGAAYSVKVPEGWSRTRSGGAVVFTDKLNSIRLEQARAATPLTAREAAGTVVPALSKSVPGYRPGAVTVVQRSAGTAVRITYLATSPANPVTGRTTVDAVERYVFFRRGRRAVLTLSGPRGADNVDPWKLVTSSVRWTR